MITVIASDPRGMRVSLGFFDEVHVPSRLLQAPSEWSQEEGVWVWHVTPEHQLFYDLENELRFRVEEVRFREERNVAASGRANAASAAHGAPAAGSRPAAGGKAPVSGRGAVRLSLIHI